MTLMVIEDDPKVGKLLEHTLSERNRRVLLCTSCEEAFEKIDGGIVPEVILLDLSLPGMGGMEFLELARKRYPDIKAIVVSANDGVDTIVEAMRAGALDFIAKPFQIQAVRVAVNEALQYRQLQQDLEARSRQPTVFSEEEPFLFTSKAMAGIMETIRRVAATTVPVLITGESGVGKELVAREIHRGSDRREGPFIKVNCAALPPNLLEGELFGFEKGAFTGAFRAKPAKFELAANGTLFLDEIGELEQGIQAKFLHVLQDGSFTRLGSNKTIRSNARIIVATNRDMEKAVREGIFRSDLYYRLNVIRVHVPPLRERRTDIAALADHFLAVNNQKFGKKVAFDDETREYILRHPWPGNVRELQNAVSRYVVLGRLGSGFELVDVPQVSPIHDSSAVPGGADGEDPMTTAADPAPADDHPYHGMTLKEVGRKAAMEAERKAILRVLEATKWNRSRAARILKVSYKALLYKMKDCGITPP